MRSLKLLATALLSTYAAAQTPLVTLSAGGNEGNAGNNIYFDLQVNQTITINQIRFLTGAVANTPTSSNGVLTVYLGPTTYVGNTSAASAGLWTPVASVTGISVVAATMCSAAFSPGFCLGPGNYGVALKSAAFNHAYTNGVTCTSNTVPGACSNSTFTRTELVLRGGANQNLPWGNGAAANEGLNQPRIFNGEIHYTLGGTPIAVAAYQPLGTGCYGFFHSFRELYGNPSTSFDLKATSGTNSLRMNFIGSGYVVQPFNTGTGTIYTPTGAATNLNLTLDDQVASFTPPFPVLYPTPTGTAVSTSLEVCTNGFISPAGSNGTTAVPTTALFLNGQPRWAPAWFNFSPNLGGQINWEVDPLGTKFYVTWVGVWDFGGTTAATANTFQVMFDNQGNVEYRYGTMSLNIGGTAPCITGWTPGGNALDPGDTDISAIATAFTTGPIDQYALRLAMGNRPLLGTSPNFSIDRMEPAQSVGGLLLGFASAPGNSLGFLGMPGCNQYVNLSGAITSLFFSSPGGPATVNFAIPNNSSFNGVLLFGQAACLGSVSNNAFGVGANASNGLRMVLGNL